MSNSYYGTSSRSSARAKARALAAPEREERWRRGIVYLLPAVLIIVTAVVTGCYYENADDMTLTLQLQGLITAQPVGALHVGMFGLSHLLTGLYQALPQVPWYGLLLYAALYLALVLHTSLLQRLGRRLLSNPQITVILTAVFLLIWAESVFWFHHARVALLLASGAFLAYAFDNKETGARHTQAAVLYTLAFLLALCIGPTAALMGLGLVLPAAIRVPSARGLDFKNLVSSLVPFVLVGLVFISATVLTRSEEEVGFHRLLGRFRDCRHNGLYFFSTPAVADSASAARSLAVREAIRYSVLGDRLAVNESFYARSGGFDGTLFVQKVIPDKVHDIGKRMLRDYYLVLLANAVIVVYCYRKLQSRTRRRLLVATQVWVVLLIAVVGLLWSLNPRLTSPPLVVLTMINLIFFLRHRRFRLPKVTIPVWVVIFLFFANHIYRIGGRALSMATKQNANEEYIDSLDRRFHGQLLVGVGFETLFPYLSPWQTYSFGQNKIVLFTGWQTMSPEFRDYLVSLTGEAQFGAAVAKLLGRPKTIWIVPLGFDQRFNRLLGAVHNTHVTLLPFKPFVPGPVNDELNEYLVAVPPGRNEPIGPLVGTLMAPRPTPKAVTTPEPAMADSLAR